MHLLLCVRAPSLVSDAIPPQYEIPNHIKVPHGEDPLHHSKERMVKQPLPTGKRRNKYIFGDERKNKELLMIQETQKNRSYSHAGR